MVASRLKRQPQRQWVTLWITALAIISMVIAPAPALASIHIYHERAEQTTYRSRLTLPDRQDQAWQATLFHRYVQGQDQGIYLRLVAFPGSAAVSPTEPLQVSTGTGIEWLAPANYALLPIPHPQNIGQYDFEEVLQTLSSPIPMTLAVPLAAGNRRELVVAPYVVEEWRSLGAMGDPSHS